MKISIITVCFNANSTIRFCIDSVISQDFQNIQYIVIDGGSNDGTLATLNEYKNHISILVSEPDNGIYDAMNKGLHFASGDWILFLNADDRLYSSETITLASKYLKDHNKNYYGTAHVTYNDNVLYQKPPAHKSMLSGTALPVHQSIFISSAYRWLRFDSSYRIAADSVHLYQLTELSKFEFIPVDIAFFRLGGVSSWYPTFSAYKRHVCEHIKYLRFRKARARTVLYVNIAFFIKYLLSRLIKQEHYFNAISYAARIKARF